MSKYDKFLFGFFITLICGIVIITTLRGDMYFVIIWFIFKVIEWFYDRMVELYKYPKPEAK